MAEDREAAIRRVVDAVNAAWMKGDAETVEGEIRPRLHDDAVFRGQGFQAVTRGGDACAASYAGFLRAARVIDVSLDEPAIDLSGDVATVTYGWRMTYALEGVEYRESGHDILVLGFDGQEWRVTWRALLAAEAPA